MIDPNDPSLDTIKATIANKSRFELVIVRDDVARMVRELEGLSQTITAQAGQADVQAARKRLPAMRNELDYLNSLVAKMAA